VSESPGVGSFSGATGDFLQALSVDQLDSSLGNPDPDVQFVEYDVVVTQTGVYDLTDQQVATIFDAAGLRWSGRKRCQERMALPEILAEIGAASTVAARLRFVLSDFCRNVVTGIAAKPSLA